jgi:hypothetical protein
VPDFKDGMRTISKTQELDTALIRVDSPDELCMVVSVQNITCPVADLEDRTGSAAEGIRQAVLSTLPKIRPHNSKGPIKKCLRRRGDKALAQT